MEILIFKFKDIIVKLFFWINHNSWYHLIFYLISALRYTIHFNFFFIWLNHKTFILVFFWYKSLLSKFIFLCFFKMQKYFWVKLAEVSLERAIFFCTNISIICIIPILIFVWNERNRCRKLDLLYEIYLLFIFFHIILAFLFFRLLGLWNCWFFFLNLANFTFCIFSFGCFYLWLIFQLSFILRY